MSILDRFREGYGGPVAVERALSRPRDLDSVPTMPRREDFAPKPPNIRSLSDRLDDIDCYVETHMQSIRDLIAERKETASELAFQLDAAESKAKGYLAEIDKLKAKHVNGSPAEDLGAPMEQGQS